MTEYKFDFENLEVYKKALKYINIVYAFTKKFPKVELFRLTQNFQGAAQSIAINLGEGSGGTKEEFRYFIKIARRSVRECIVCTTIAKERKYINDAEELESRKICTELSKMLTGLSKSLK